MDLLQSDASHVVITWIVTFLPVWNAYLWALMVVQQEPSGP
jgi:ABC-type glycerol-3-phosphate transport system permease component